MLKIYIIATEPSGDAIGSNLISSLIKLSSKNKIKFYGIGGPKMIRMGLKKSLFPIEELSIFGLFEIIPKIFKISNLLSKTIKDLDNIKPNILVTIDSPDFNFRILKRLKKKSYKIKKVHYVAPTVWAWREGRAKFLANHSDKLLTILPFETKYFTKYKLKTKFIGHPVFDIKIHNLKKVKDIKRKYNIKGNTKILSFLPGSRFSEFIKTMPVLIDTIKVLKRKFKNHIHVFIYVLPHLKKYINKFDLNFPFSLIKENNKYDAFNSSDVAISASGTVALELSYFKVPTIVIYKVNPLTYLIAKLFIKFKYANLINILRNKEIISEFIQFECKPKLIANNLLTLLNDKNYAKKQILEVKKTMPLLKDNDNLPSINAANEILKIE